MIAAEVTKMNHCAGVTFETLATSEFVGNCEEAYRD
jgi:hypothetical protein